MIILKRPIRNLLSKFYILDIIRRLRISGYEKNLKDLYISARETGELPFPNSAVFEPTAKCNLSCSMCFFDRTIVYKDRDMSLDEIKKSFKKFSRDIKRMIITGGECFVRLDIFEILRFLDKEGILLHITTNGTLINEKNIEEIKRNRNIVHMGISIDGTEELHNKIRGQKSAFSDSINAIKILKKAKIPINMVCVILKENLSSLTDVVRLGKNLNVDSVYFELERIYKKNDVREVQDVLNAKKNEVPLINDSDRGYKLELLRDVLGEVDNLGRELGQEIHYYPNFLNSKIKDCYSRSLRQQGRKYFCMALLNLRIAPNGNVLPCFAIRTVMGNVLESDPHEFWNSEKFKQFRRNLLQNNLVKACETCLYMKEIK